MLKSPADNYLLESRFVENPVLLNLASLILAVLLDRWLGEPKGFHPLVAFGNWASALEKRLNLKTESNLNQLRGVIAWSIAIIPLVAITALLVNSTQSLSVWFQWILQSVILYLCIGWRSLKEHMLAIYNPLINGDLVWARQACAMVVSRDTEKLSENQIAKSAIESTLENGMDSVFSVMFWFVLLGLPGAILYRLANTLDAMWGYRTERFESFGKWAAKLDDLLNWVPARITAALYLLSLFLHYGNEGTTRIKIGLKKCQQQSPLLASPNGGPVMVAGGFVLDTELGGPTYYHGKWTNKAFFGGSQEANANHIFEALKLVKRSIGLWLVVCFLISASLHTFYG